MHLRDGGRSNGFAKLKEKLAYLSVERGFDCRDRLLKRKRRHAILQFLQLTRRIDADDIRPRRQKLSQFDVGRPKLRHGAGQPLWILARAAAGDQLGETKRHTRRWRQNSRIHVRKYAFARENPARVGQTRYVTESSKHRV